ncbi:MAG: hypothetical protein QG552_2455 [Thermodesulfobacteriota bacterium]|nr:hypothetical protein [Thermodesulfobacteriota bacterium]
MQEGSAQKGDDGFRAGAQSPGDKDKVRVHRFRVSRFSGIQG